jgi:DNA polymerase-3 subunit beta
LQALPPEDFPALAGSDFSNQFNAGVKDIKFLLDTTRFAISTEETRYYLNGIYLHDVDSGPYLRAVATDGHRLAQAQLARPEGAQGIPGVIVPRKTVLELGKLLDSAEGEVNISLSTSKVRFTLGQIVLTSKLIDGTFPDYERVIPRNNDKVLEVDRNLFAGAVDRVSTISFEKSRAVKLAAAAGRLTLAVNNPDSGSAEEEIPADFNADLLEIGFNSRYLSDVASQIGADTMRFEMQDAGSPTIVRDPSNAHCLYVLMPMRV